MSYIILYINIRFVNILNINIRFYGHKIYKNILNKIKVDNYIFSSNAPLLCILQYIK